jgi:hypothetical protein
MYAVSRVFLRLPFTIARSTLDDAFPEEGGSIVSAVRIPTDWLADRVGFEPTIRLPVCRISSAVLSTAQPPVRAAEVHDFRAIGKAGPQNKIGIGPNLDPSDFGGALATL